MSAYYQRHGVTVHHGDCLDVLRELPDESVHAVICDPPYGLADHKPERIAQAVTAWTSGDRDHVPSGSAGFMGRDWDSFVPPPAVWDECLRVLRPGGHLLAFAGSRTADLMGLSIRLAGFEIRDTIMWVYGSGFPKGQDVSKAIDKAAGAAREVVGPSRRHVGGRNDKYAQDAWTQENAATMGMHITAPATPEAAQWEGWNTSLKPSQEPIIVARKPLSGTVAATVLAHGTGAINVDACRVQMSAADREFIIKTARPNSAGQRHEGDVMNRPAAPTVNVHDGGRWPANVVLVHAETCEDGGVCEDSCPVAELDRQSGTSKSPSKPFNYRRSTDTDASVFNGTDSKADTRLGKGAHVTSVNYGDSGGASRYFPVFRWEPKAPTTERPQVAGKSHPTVKPLALMRWLVRLVTPPGGTVLDCFAGSGATLQAARAEGFTAIGIERDPESLPYIRARLDARPRQATAPVSAPADDEPMDLLDLLDGEAS